MTTTNSTSTSTTNPVRSDLGATLPGQDERPARRRRPSKAWAIAGVVAGVTSLAGGVASGMVNVVYREELVGDEAGILAELGDFVPHLIAFHVLTTLSALAMTIFGLGLARRLRAALPADSLLPSMAAFGLLGTSVVQVIGTSLDTEFIFGLATPEVTTPSAAVMYNHWVGTVPWCLVLVGLSALATYAAARQGALPRWFGRVGLVLGGISILVALAPLQYMAAATGGLWILITAVGFLLGDRAHRSEEQTDGDGRV
jgi:hypothetical protein